jgi:phosphate starvation-inducible membrane PsiE
MLGALTVINPSKLNGKHMYHLLLESEILHFIFMGFLAVNTDNFRKQHYPVDLFIMVKWCVFSDVRTKCLSIMCMSFCLR